jgi:hypothetical protein
MSEAQLEKERAGSRWRGRRVAAMALRVLVFLCPVSVAVALGLLVSHSIPSHPLSLMAFRVLATAVVSLLAFIVVERLGRRFLPLAALLRLNLVFPDQAPSRFGVALRSTSVRKLQLWVREARDTDDTAALAEKVVTLASALNTHDRRTRGHCERTRALADLIVEELHLSPAEANEVRWGAFLHDIGKLAVPPEILNKPGKPTAHEWDVLRSHPVAGARLVEPLRGFLHSGVDAVGSHHENFDGTGYPAGLAGEELPLAARIVSVADSFEVMTAVRAYKRPMSLQAARAELARRSGTQFDPQVVRAFLNVSLGRVHWTLGMAAWLAELPFLTVLPRVAAQLGATTGAVSPITLPTIAAASLGAMAVVAPLPPHAGARPTPVAAARLAHAPSTRGSDSSSTALDTTAPKGQTASATGSAWSAPLPPVVEVAQNKVMAGVLGHLAATGHPGSDVGGVVDIVGDIGVGATVVTPAARIVPTSLHTGTAVVDGVRPAVAATAHAVAPLMPPVTSTADEGNGPAGVTTAL